MFSTWTFLRPAFLGAAAFLGVCRLASGEASGLSSGREDYRVLRAFGRTGGGSPHTALVKAADGNLYGATQTEVFRWTPDGTYAAIGGTPEPPVGDPIQASDGHLYLTSPTLIYRMSLDGEVTILHTIRDTHLEGIIDGPLVEGDDRNLYGFTTLNGDFGLGTVFRITPEGVFTTLHSLTAAEGVSGFTKLIRGSDGYMYGNRVSGGIGYGNLFRMTTDGTATILHAFTGGAGGSVPRGGVIQAADGSLYGTTAFGGAHDRGTIFRLGSDGAFTVLYSFTGLAPGGDGITGLYTRLLAARDGALYGTGEYGIFRLAADGSFRLLHSTYAYPGYVGNRRYGWSLSSLVEGDDGNFYGTANTGGPGNGGAIFRLNRRRSPCFNALDLTWSSNDDGTGTLYLTGAVKSETPALAGSWLVSAHGVETLGLRFTPAVTPTFSYEFALPLTNRGSVGVFTVVVTSGFRVCADWTTADTGGRGPSEEDLERLLGPSAKP